MPSLPGVLDWSLFLSRFARDQLFQKIGYYPHSAAQSRTKYISPQGVALACDTFVSLRYVMYGHERRARLLDGGWCQGLAEGAVVWLRADELPLFAEHLLPRLAGRCVLVTGDSDLLLPSAFPAAADSIARSGKVLHWFVSQYDGSDAGVPLTALPLGLNYPRINDVHRLFSPIGTTRVDFKRPAVQEREWEGIAAAARPLADRIPRAVADFQLNDTSRDRRFGESRSDIFGQLRDNRCVAWLPRRGSQSWLLEQYARHAFVLSPHGYGLDCYRTWEALFMGCIPIVKTSPLDLLYRDLPVAIVEDWRDIGEERLAGWLAAFGEGFDREPLRRALSLDSWQRRFRAAAGGDA
jgi:hypothetical protein